MFVWLSKGLCSRLGSSTSVFLDRFADVAAADVSGAGSFRFEAPLMSRRPKWDDPTKEVLPGPKQLTQKAPPAVKKRAPDGFGWSQPVFEKLDPYFPKDMLKMTIKKADVDDALERMAECFKASSIQVEFENNPAGAKLRTLEHIELYLIFFEDENGDLAVDLQRRQGDYLDANRYVHRILEAAKGTAAVQQDATPVRSAKRIREFETFLDRCGAPSQQPKEGSSDASSRWATPPSPEESMKSTLDCVHASLTSKQLDQRKVGLDQLAIFTDLDKTLSQTAITTALVVIQGRAPVAGYEKQCREIQKVLSRVIMKQDFAGDDTKMYSDMDADIVDFMSSGNGNTRTSGRSRYYDQYMNEMRHLVLNILANSLEVLQVFEEDNSNAFEIRGAISELNVACAERVSDSDGPAGIVEALVGLVGRAEQRLPDAYLACKALRLLLEASPDSRSIFKGKQECAEVVQKATNVGKYNAKLLAEAKELQRFL